MKHTVAELKQMQSLPLEAKVAMTKARVATWIREFESEERRSFYQVKRNSS